MLRHTLLHLQQGFSLQHLHLLLWFVIAFRARRVAQADRLSAGALGLPSRRRGQAVAAPRPALVPFRRPAAPPPALAFLPLLIPLSPPFSPLR